MLGMLGMSVIFEMNVMGYLFSCIALEIGSGFECVVH